MAVVFTSLLVWSNSKNGTAFNNKGNTFFSSSSFDFSFCINRNQKRQNIWIWFEFEFIGLGFVFYISAVIITRLLVKWCFCWQCIILTLQIECALCKILKPVDEMRRMKCWTTQITVMQTSREDSNDFNKVERHKNPMARSSIEHWFHWFAPLKSISVNYFRVYRRFWFMHISS